MTELQSRRKNLPGAKLRGQFEDHLNTASTFFIDNAPRILPRRRWHLVHYKLAYTLASLLTQISRCEIAPRTAPVYLVRKLTEHASGVKVVSR